MGTVPLRGAPPGEVMIPRQREEHFENEGERSQVAIALANILEAMELHPNVCIKETKKRVELGEEEEEKEEGESSAST